LSEARENILSRLRGNTVAADPPARSAAHDPGWDTDARIARFTERQQAVHGEVHRLGKSEWLNWLALELPRRGLRRVLAGTGKVGNQLVQNAGRGLSVEQYKYSIEQWKPTLFVDVDVAITGADWGIAETGSLVLWPDADEPRLMSLAPPVHIALLRAETLYQNFAELIEAEHWANGMPTNALLISGPSKTADIEQTLAYGIHGPKELITLILE